MARLVEDLGRLGISTRFVARGGSMSPWIRDGDLVTVAPLESAIARVGDVAAYRRSGSDRLIVHRLVRRSKGAWIAQGDRLPAPDGPVADAEILGIVARVERRGRPAFVPRGLAGVLLARLSRLALNARR
jgi:signal peptidase I